VTWTSKSPSYQGLRTPLRVIPGRCKMTVLRTEFLIKAGLELLSWNYRSLLLNRSTDRPTHFREDGGDGWGGGRCVETYLRGKYKRFSFANFMTQPNSFNIIQQS